MISSKCCFSTGLEIIGRKYLSVMWTKHPVTEDDGEGEEAKKDLQMPETEICVILVSGKIQELSYH